MRYLGILCVRNRNRRYRYVEQLRVSLENVCVRVLEIYGENPGLREAGTLLRTHDFGDCTGIILLKDDVFGSFYDLNGLLKAMEKKYDLWGLDFDTVRSQVENCPVLCESFLVINERLVHLYDLKQALETNTFGEYLLYGSGIVRGCMVSGSPVVKAGELDMCLSMPYEAVAGKRVPFLPIEIFTLTDRILKYSLQHELRRVLEYLEKEEFVTDGIWEYIIAEVNVGDLRRLLHLDYLIASDRTAVHSLRDKRVAVFAHIYYDDLYERCIAYLKRLPEEVDIYVSTKQKGMSVLREKLAAASVP